MIPCSIRFLILLAILVSARVSNAEIRVFVGTNGKTIKAEVVSVVDGFVQLKREDGKLFKTKLTSFVEEDQAYILHWEKENKTFKFNVQTRKTKLNHERKGTSRQYTTTEEWRYQLDVTNVSFEDLKDVRLKYRIYIENQAESNKRKSGEPTIRIVGGSVDIPELPNVKQVTIATEPVVLTEARTTTSKTLTRRVLVGDRYENQEYVEVSSSGHEEKLDGVFFRLYKGERLLGEFREDGKSVKTAEWQELIAPNAPEEKGKPVE